MIGIGGPANFRQIECGSFWSGIVVIANQNISCLKISREEFVS